MALNSWCGFKGSRCLESAQPLQEKLVEADIISYNSLLRWCHWQRAMELLQRSGLQATSISYNSIMASMASMASRGPWQKSLAVPEEMLQSDLKVSEVTYGAATNACSDRWHDTILLLRDMRRRMQRRNVIVHTAAIDACEKAEQWQLSLAMLDDGFTKLLVNLVTYTASISACVKGTRWEGACFLHAELEDRSAVLRCAGNAGNGAVTRTAAMQGFIKGSLWQSAIRLVMNVRFLDAMAVATAMDACVKGLQWSQVLWLFSSTVATNSLAAFWSQQTNQCGCAGCWFVALLKKPKIWVHKHA
eukprot:Skav230459  [mRNA]  locus=scaffold186:63693:64992:+ [translate_table: standard]